MNATKARSIRKEHGVKHVRLARLRRPGTLRLNWPRFARICTEGVVTEPAITRTIKRA